MDQVFTQQFWHDQWAVVMSAPWVVIPLVLIAFGVGWKWKGANDDGEIRGLREGLDVAAQRLDFAGEKYEAADEKYKAVVNRENELKDKVARQEKVIAELKKAGVAPNRFVELSTSNTEIKNALTNLSTSTFSLGESLTALQALRNSTMHTPPAGLPFEQKGDVDLTKRKGSKPKK